MIDNYGTLCFRLDLATLVAAATHAPVNVEATRTLPISSGLNSNSAFAHEANCGVMTLWWSL
jgi:hypothetical protein